MTMRGLRSCMCMCGHSSMQDEQGRSSRGGATKQTNTPRHHSQGLFSRMYMIAGNVSSQRRVNRAPTRCCTAASAHQDAHILLRMLSRPQHAPDSTPPLTPPPSACARPVCRKWIRPPRSPPACCIDPITRTSAHCWRRSRAKPKPLFTCRQSPRRAWDALPRSVGCGSYNLALCLPTTRRLGQRIHEHIWPRSGGAYHMDRSSRGLGRLHRLLCGLGGAAAMRK
jgi:hypothetical protein